MDYDNGFVMVSLIRATCIIPALTQTVLSVLLTFLPSNFKLKIALPNICYLFYFKIFYVFYLVSLIMFLTNKRHWSLIRIYIVSKAKVNFDRPNSNKLIYNWFYSRFNWLKNYCLFPFYKIWDDHHSLHATV